MKTAVVFYSMSGNTEYVAERISGSLGADLIKIEPDKAYPDTGAKKFIFGGKSAVMGDTPKLKPYGFDAGAYDRIIFGTPVWAGTFAPPLRSFIKENKPAIDGKSIAVYTCALGKGGEKAAEKLKKFLGIDRFEQSVSLIEPKGAPSPDNERAIDIFCLNLKNSG